MRKKIVAGNWKMNLNLQQAIDIVEGTSGGEECEVYFFSPSLFLDPLLQLSAVKSDKIHIGAQNAYPKDSGAFTGEISMKQLANLGIKNVLIGHSERRQHFNESASFLKDKVDAALSNNLQAFFCCGESLKERENGKHMEVVINQLNDAVFHLSPEDFSKIVIAYEPVWAIGTGKTASSEQAEEMHSEIRKAIVKKYGNIISDRISILYGGSCKPSNAKELFGQKNIDGGLIGGASLKTDDFNTIISSI